MTSLPVADPSLVLDDGASSIPIVDISHSFFEVLTQFVNWFRYIIAYFDSIYIFSNVTLLDFHLAISIFGIIFLVFFSVIRANTSYNFVDNDLRRAARQHNRDYDSRKNYYSRRRYYSRSSQGKKGGP